jgi:hypothetical protein
MNAAVVAELESIATHDLVEVVGQRLEVPVSGTAKLELTFNDGEWVGSNYHEKIPVAALGCVCGRHRWNPACTVHPRSDDGAFGAR